MAWKTEGIKNNGATGDILADTGAQVAGLAAFTLIFWSNVGTTLEIVQRDATNTNDVNIQRWYTAGSTYIYNLPVNLVVNQRIVVRVKDGYEGDFQVSIMW